MKKLVLAVFILNCQLSIIHCNAQTLSPSVLPSAGGYFSASNGSLSWTIGETVIPTLTAGSNMLTQGFQQPEVQVRTGTVTTSLCPGSIVSVPFTSSGIISASNIFTAQLSNATGSFASPTTIGTLTGNMVTGTITATIPPATAVGAAYRIRVISSLPAFIGSNNGTNISVINTCSITLNLTLFLQGYYTGTSSMTPVLMNQGIGVSATIVDTITVELRNEFTPTTLVATTKVLLNTNGTATCSFPVTAGNYYIVVKHRNTIQTWSAAPVALGAIPVSYNFSTGSNTAYGDNMILVSAGVWAFYSGDLNADENIDLLDASAVETDINAFQFGYFATDINGDGNVDLLDAPVVETNISNFIFSNHP